MRYEEEQQELQSIGNFIRDFKRNILTFWKQSDFHSMHFWFDDVEIDLTKKNGSRPKNRDVARIWRTLTESRDNLTNITSSRHLGVVTEDIDEENVMVEICLNINIMVNDETYIFFITFKIEQNLEANLVSYSKDDLEYIQEKTLQVFKENLRKHFIQRRSIDLYSARGPQMKDLPDELKTHVKSYLAGGASAQQKSLLLKRMQDIIKP